MGDSTFTQVNDTVLSKKFVTPTKQNYVVKEITIVPFGKFSNVENRRGPDGIGTHIMGANNESSSKADTVYHSPRKSNSSAGKTFSRPPTCVSSPNLRKSNCSSASPAAGAICRSLETGTTDKIEHPASTERTTSAGNRWFKRLQHKHSETQSLCAKRFKTCDDSSSEMEYSDTVSHGVNRCVEERKFEKTMAFSENDSPSLCDREEALQSWIRRWRCNHNQTSPAAVRVVAPVAFQLSRKVEGEKFASIGAMALMGKAINNYRPCRIRRKDASIVWTT